MTTRKMGPLPVDHPEVGKECAACKQPYKAGDYVTIIPIGPGDDQEERQRDREGRAYNAVGVTAHWSCATGEE